MAIGSSLRAKRLKEEMGLEDGKKRKRPKKPFKEMTHKEYEAWVRQQGV